MAQQSGQDELQAKGDVLVVKLQRTQDIGFSQDAFSLGALNVALSEDFDQTEAAFQAALDSDSELASLLALTAGEILNPSLELLQASMHEVAKKPGLVNHGRSEASPGGGGQMVGEIALG